MSTLTRDQCEVIFTLGGKSGDFEIVPDDVFQELIELGLVRSRSQDGRLVLTALGESVYEELVGPET